MLDDVKKTSEQRMRKSVDSLKIELAKLRTGRAHPSLLDHIRVTAYNSEMPLNQVANISVGDSRTLLVAPWDKGLVDAVDKAIRNAGLGLNPVTAGQSIRVPLPPLNEERRREMIKMVRGEAENARVAIRNIRRDANTRFKELLKEKKISEDENRRGEETIQKLTDKLIGEVDALLATKEAELMEV